MKTRVKNVTKIINSMRVFNKKKVSDNLSSVSSDSSLNDIMNNSQTNNNVKIIIEDKNNIEKSKSAEEIFIEISQQCEELTDTLNTQINESKQYDTNINDTNIKDTNIEVSNNNETEENSIKISDTDLIIKLAMETILLVIKL